MHDRGHSSEPLRQVLQSIAHAERVLLHHAHVSSEAGHAVTLQQHAQQLITHLQQHAQRSQGDLETATTQNSNAPSDTNVTFSISEADLNASTTALQTVFDSNLLSELCAVLHSLYVRQARLSVPTGASAQAVAAKAHHVDVNKRTSLQADCIQNVGSMSLAINSMAAAQSGQSAEHTDQNMRPHSLAAALGHPQQYTDMHQQLREDPDKIAALRCA